MLKRVGLLLAILSLTGCVGAVFTGADLAYDRYKIAKRLDNHALEIEARQLITTYSKGYTHSNIKAERYAGVLLLYGQTPYPALEKHVVTGIRKIPNIGKVVNHITRGKPLSFSQNTADLWIHGKIELLFLRAKEIDPDPIKTIVENRTVFLLGNVTPQQANAAIYLSRRVDGVKRVVKLFHLINLVEN